MVDPRRGEQTGWARLVAVPHEWPAAQRRRAQTVLGLATTMLVAAVPAAVVVGVMLPDRTVNVALVAMGVPVYLLIRRLVRRSHVIAAGWVLTAFFLVVPTVGSLALGQTRVSVFFFVVGVVLAGAVLPPRAVVLAGSVGLALLFLLPAYAPAPAEYSRQDVLAFLALSLALVAGATVVSAVSAEVGYRAADRSRNRAERLTEELRLANTMLEERVRRRTDQLSAALDRERRLSQSLAELTVRDPLTGLHNRRHLDDELIRLVARSHRRRSPLSVAVIDLDDFKAVNDLFTHATGDDVLRAAASVLSEQTRTSDVLVRMGGEEFALLMPDTDTDAAVHVCERMRQRLAAYDWETVQRGLRVTASFGVATSTGDDTAAQLLRQADVRLFEAKRLGKNRVVEVSTR